MIYVIHCELLSDSEKEQLEKTIRESAPSRKMTDTLWLIEADSMPSQIETILQSLKVKSFIAPLHPDGPGADAPLATDMKKRNMLYIIHSQLLLDAEKELLEKIIQDSAPSHKLTDTLWLIEAESVPKQIGAFLQSLQVNSFVAPLHPSALCGGNLLLDDKEWILLHSSKHQK